MQRIAITGMGAISAAGLGVSALWDAARSGRTGVKDIALQYVRGNRVRIAATVAGFNPADHIAGELLRTCDRYAQFAMFAAHEAIAMSGLEPGHLCSERTAVVIGTGVGGVGTFDENCRAYHAGEKCDTMAIPRTMPSSAVSHIGIRHGIIGPTFTVTSACASASQAIGMAATMIRAGIVDRVITGGSESCLTASTMRGWEYLRVLSPDACRPFSAGRNGMVIGEGAGICVLECETAARSRGARPLAWLAGYGTSSDARDMVRPDVDGAARAVAAALADAGLPPEAVGHINAHGTGTVLNDINEVEALRRVFGGALDDIPVCSSKPIVGHTLGAAGALELLVAICSIQDQIVPPQINFRGADPKCRLNLQLDSARSHAFDVALSNSFAFGGINAALVVSRAH